MRRKIILLLFLFLISAGAWICVQHLWQVREVLLLWSHDARYDSAPVNSRESIDKVLSELQVLPYSSLEQEYLNQSKSTEAKYVKMCKNLNYYMVTREQLHHVIVGSFRLKDFICTDASYKQCVTNNREHITCALDKRIFYKTLDLIQSLEQKGHDPSAFSVKNGHRHPAYNEQIGGASLSRHIRGEAVDIVVADIDKNGRIEQEDKDIILDILETEVIKDQGGIGRYPGSMSVHYDVRGTRARWDSY